MSRSRSNAKPVVVEAPVVSTPAALPLIVAPVAIAPVAIAPVAQVDTSAADRIAELELDVEARDASIVALNATVEALRAQVAALSSSAPVAASEGAFKRRVTGHCGIRFRGREYHEGDVFPFDPTDPPHDVSGVYVEGIHYRYE